MRICFTAASSGLDATFEERFGRAPFFIFCDADGNDIKSVENPFSNSSGGVGPRAVQLINDNGADVLITGRMGDNAREAFLSTGKSAFAGTGGKTVADVLEDYRSGNLSPLV